MDKPLLSICIPTYNRDEYLVKTIESIICQEEFKNKKVEIVVSDNASVDDTERIVKRYESQHENIHYYRNDKNINNDNFPLVLSRGNGILRRLCNDTLCFKKGALKYICDIIEKYQSTKPYLCWIGNIHGQTIEEMNFSDGVRKASYWLTSIGSFSIWDSECEGIENDTYGAQLLLWQLRKALEIASKKNKMVLINKMLSFNQAVYKKNISYGLYHVFYENYFTLYEPYFDNGMLTQNDREYLEKDLLLNFFPVWCVMWKLQNSSLQYSETEDLCKKIYDQFKDKPYWKAYQNKCNKLMIKLRIKGFLKRILRRG